MSSPDTHPLAQLRALLVATFPDQPTDYSDSDDLVERGVLGSLGTVELVLALESAFGVRFAPHEITPGDFSTLQQIAALIERKRRRG